MKNQQLVKILLFGFFTSLCFSASVTLAAPMASASSSPNASPTSSSSPYASASSSPYASPTSSPVSCRNLPENIKNQCFASKSIQQNMIADVDIMLGKATQKDYWSTLSKFRVLCAEFLSKKAANPEQIGACPALPVGFEGCKNSEGQNASLISHRLIAESQEVLQLQGLLESKDEAGLHSFRCHAKQGQQISFTWYCGDIFTRSQTGSLVACNLANDPTLRSTAGKIPFASPSAPPQIQ